MTLEINNIDGVICLKGNVSSTTTQELTGYFKALLTIQDTVLINMCQIKEGAEILTSVFENLKKDIQEKKTLDYFGFATEQVKQLYANINHPSNFYQAA